MAIAIDQFEAELRDRTLDASTLTLAELVLGATSAPDAAVRARRNRRLQRLDQRLRWLDFDSTCGLAYGQICLATIRLGRRARGSRSVDLMIAATALAYRIPLLTLNAADFRGLDELVEIVDLS